MIVTLRTLPRSSGETSVVLTRAPSDPRDPEVVGVFVTSRAAVHWMLEAVCRIGRKAGDRLRGYESRYSMREDGPSSGTVKLELRLEAGEELTVTDVTTS